MSDCVENEDDGVKETPLYDPECEDISLEPIVQLSTVNSDDQNGESEEQNEDSEEQNEDKEEQNEDKEEQNENKEEHNENREDQNENTNKEPVVNDKQTEDNEEQIEGNEEQIEGNEEQARYSEEQTEDNEEQNEDNFFPFDSLSVEINEDPVENDDDDRMPKTVSDAQGSIPSVSFDESAETTQDFNNLNGEIYNSADSTVTGSNESSQGAAPFDEDIMVKRESIDPEEFKETSLEDFIYAGTPKNFDEGSNSGADEPKEEGRRYSLYRFPKVLKALDTAEYETLQILYQLLYQRSAWDTEEILKQRILEFSGFSFSNNSEEYYNRDMMLKTQPNEVLVKIGDILGLDHVKKMYVGGDKARSDLIAAIMHFLTIMRHLSRRRARPGKVSGAANQDTPSQTLISKCGCRSRCLGKTTKVQRRAYLQYLNELAEKKILDSYLFNLMEIKKHERRPGPENRQKIKEVAYQYKVKFGPKEFVVCKGGFTVYHGLSRRGLAALQRKLKDGEELPPKIDMKDFPKFQVPEIPRKVSPRKFLYEVAPKVQAVSSLQSNEELCLKTDEELKNAITQQKVVPKIIVEKLDAGNIEGAKYKLMASRRAWEKEDMVNALNAVKKGDMGCGSASRVYNVPRSTLKRYVAELGDIPIDKYVDIKMGLKPSAAQTVAQKVLQNAQKKLSVTETLLEKINEETRNSVKEAPEKKQSDKSKLKDFPLVVTAIESASKELLIDVHFLLFLEGAEDDEVKGNILNFSGFSFDSDTEEFDERNEFLQRMSFKIVGDVARSFSLEILSSKEDTIKNILSFLKKPDESYLKVTSSLPLSLSDVELDDIEGFSDSDESITCEVVEKKVECIDLISSGEDSDDDKPSKVKTPKKAAQKAVKPTSNVASSSVAKPSTVQPVITNVQSTPPPSTTATAATSQSSSQNQFETNSQTSTQSGQRTLRDFETICKIVNTHPHEYLIDIFDLLYLKKHEPATLRKDILDFSGFAFDRGSPDYVKRKQLLDRMLYNSVRRIYNTLIHNTTEVKVFSKPTMITEIFQFLFKLPDHDTSVRPPQVAKTVMKSPFINTPKTPVGAVPPPVIPVTNQTGKLSDLKRVFQRVACFPCEYLIDVHKLLFMTDCDPKVIRQNIFAFKGFWFGPESQEFQQRKMYLEYLTFHSLRKISSVLTTRSVDLRNSTKHELASHLTQVLAEYCNTFSETEIPEIHMNNQNNQNVAVTSSSDNSAVENIVVTPTLDPSLANPPVEPIPVKADKVPDSNTAVTPKPQQVPALAISIVDARSISSPAVTTTSNKRKRKSTTVSKVVTEKKSSPQPETNQFADINLPEVEKYRQLYGQNNINIYNPNLPTITGITTFNAAGIPQTFPMTQAVNFPIMQVQPSQVIGVPIISQVQNKPSEVIVPGECITNDEEPISKKQKVPVEKAPSGKSGSLEETNSFHNKIRDAISADDEDCDKPLASLIGHPIDSVLRKNIMDIVEQTDLQDITINGVIQKVYSMYPKFDLSYRKEFIKSTVRSMLYKLGEQKNSDIKTGDRNTNSPDCSVTTTDIQDNNLDVSPETSMECS